MTCDPNRIRAAHKALEMVAMQFTVEEALNGLAAVAAEAVISATASKDERDNLMRIFDTMVRDFARQAVSSVIDMRTVN